MPNMKSQPLWLVGPLYVVAYAAMVWLSLLFAPTHFGVVPWGPETGLTFAAFLLLGRRIWPFMPVAVAAQDIIVHGDSFPIAAQVFAPIIVGGGYALALTWLVNPKWRFDPRLRAFRDVQLLGAVAILSSILVACGYTSLLLATGLLQRSEAWQAIFQLATADLIGISVVTPFLLLLYAAKRLPRLTIEALIQAALIVAALVLAFGAPSFPHFRLFNVVFFPIIWIALSYGLQGATYGLLFTQMGLIVALYRLGDQPGNLAAFQGLMLVLAFTGLAIGGLVTERRRVEQQLRLNQESVAEILRLGSVGELATAIAHEINQPLTAIANYTRLIEQYLVEGKGDRNTAIEAATKAVAQVGRTDAVVKSFRNLVKRGRPQIKAETVQEVFRETLELITPVLQREGVDVTVSVERNVPRIMVDKLQIEQVLVNLIANGNEAMAVNEPGDKHLHLRAKNLPGTGEVEIMVSDNGPGFPPDFDIRRSGLMGSTKEDGLGVGLSVSRTIVESHGGELAIGGSAKGAVVSIRLRAQSGASL
jgi:two-component system, LuxR family, sensor kinase FixL